MLLTWFAQHNQRWWFQMNRLMGEAGQGGGEAHELLRTFERIRLGNREDWYEEFRVLADLTAAAGREALDAGHRVTARQHLLRACNYYRAAELFMASNDPQRAAVYAECLRVFADAAPLFSPALERVEVPFEDGLLPGYFALPADGWEEPGPVLIYIGGVDVFKETLFFLGAAEALRRGMAILVVDGPGQGETLRLRGKTMMPDYERVVQADVDYLLRRPEVDRGRVGLMGRSLGGYYAVRAAAHERRIRACVVFGACYDIGEVYELWTPERRRHLESLLGVQDEQTAREKFAAFRLEGLGQLVRCPVLVVHAEDDPYVPVAHAHRTFEQLGGEKALRVYRSGEPGSMHCQYDNFPQTLSYMCDWLLDHLQ